MPTVLIPIAWKTETNDPYVVMLYWFQLNPHSPKVNWCANKSEVKDPSINTCQDCSDGKAWDCKHKKWALQGSIPVKGNFFCRIYFALTQFWQISQNDIFKENLDCTTLFVQCTCYQNEDTHFDTDFASQVKLTKLPLIHCFEEAISDFPAFDIGLITHIILST